LPAGARTVLLSTEPPRFECLEFFKSWNIAIPPAMTEEIVKRLHAQDETEMLSGALNPSRAVSARTGATVLRTAGPGSVY
ncbi:MAG: hypothetical protein ACREIV_17210, partial [Planctomycetaceae bacterium]